MQFSIISPTLQYNEINANKLHCIINVDKQAHKLYNHICNSKKLLMHNTT